MQYRAIMFQSAVGRYAARVFNVTRATAAKWMGRDDVQDRSHRTNTLHTTLTEAEEGVVLSLRETLYLPLDDSLYITREYIKAAVSRSGLARRLKRKGMACLEDVILKAEGETVQRRREDADSGPQKMATGYAGSIFKTGL